MSQVHRMFSKCSIICSYKRIKILVFGLGVSVHLAALERHSGSMITVQMSAVCNSRFVQWVSIPWELLFGMVFGLTLEGVCKKGKT